MARFLANYWFLCLLGICLIVGSVWGSWLQPAVDSTFLRGAIVFVVMFLVSLTLNPDAFVGNVRNPLPAILAITFNVVLVPILAILFAWSLPKALADGLLVAALAPCTLASASVWTQRARGDSAVSMLTTMITNLGCFVVIPLGLAMLLNQTTDFAYHQHALRLLLLVGVPIVLAQAVRKLGVAIWADSHRQVISLLAQCGMLAMVTLGAVESRQHLTPSFNISVGMSWVTMILVVTLVHIVALAAGIKTTRLLGLARSQQIAVGIAGSQKTMMIGLDLAITCGVSVLPMVAYHASQLIVDTLVVDHWVSEEPITDDPVL